MDRLPIIPVLTAAEAAEWDDRARKAAEIPSRVLMETAGRAVASVLAQAFAPRLGEGVLVVAGAGNNGGDGWVAARALAALGVHVRVAEAAGRRSADCQANRALALAAGVEALAPGAAWPAVGVIVDALLGTGAGGAPRGAVAELAERAASHGAPIVAIDGPTGLDLTTGQAHGPIRADVTVTFGGLRRGHLLRRGWCGRLVVVEIGFPAADATWPELVTDAWAAALLPPLAAPMHKGDRGRILVVGGAAGMAGAAMHVARGAFATGAGLVKLALAHDSVIAAQAHLPDALTVVTGLGLKLEPALVEAMAWSDAIVLGPGLGREEPRRDFVQAVLSRAQVPVVLDADALHVLDDPGTGDVPRVLTPHPGEFAAAFPDVKITNGDRFAAVSEAAGRLGTASAILLKGVPTVIASGERMRIVARGNPGLATGGSGDVLAGVIGALLARGLAPFEAAALGAQAHGRAAEIAAEAIAPRAMRPDDVAASLAALWRRWRAPTPPTPPILLDLAAPALT